MDTFQVRKRGGGLEPWNVEKTINSVAVAGISMEEAEAIAALVHSWAKRSAEASVVSSTQIRDKVVEILGVVDSTAKDAYIAYKK